MGVCCGADETPTDKKGIIKPSHICPADAPYCRGHEPYSKYGDCHKFPPLPGKGGQWCVPDGVTGGAPYFWSECYIASNSCSEYGHGYHYSNDAVLSYAKYPYECNMVQASVLC